MTAICKITDGVTSVNLLGDAFYISDWRPSGVTFKDDGYWQNPSLADGRRLSQYSLNNVMETIVLSQTSVSHDAALRQANKLARLLLDAAEFSVNPKHGRKPVYLEIKSTTETNTRYAYIHAGTVGEYGNPFSQPFLQPGCRASVENISVTLERGQWLEAPPGTDVCQPIQPTGKPTDATFYDYDDTILGTQPPIITWPAFALWKLNETAGSTAVNSSIHAGLNGSYGASASLDDKTFWNHFDPTAFLAIATGEVDIYSTALNSRFNGQAGSVLAWVNTSGPIWTGGNDAYFINIQVDANNYIRIYHPGTIIDNSIQWEYTAGGTTASWREDDFSTTDEWFSVGMTWSQTQLGNFNIRFYLNGTLVAGRLSGATWTGNLSSTLCAIGASDNSGSDGAASNMAYVALWDAPLTDDDMAMIGVPSEGFLTNGSDLDCDDIVTYIGNKRNLVELTHAFTHDASPSTFGSNIIAGTPPFALLPTPIAANDAMYFGNVISSVSGLPHGPFNSLVLDIATAANATTSYTYVWEYWSGATWTTLTVVDNTDGFQETGINSVHWVQPTNWADTTINGVNARWVRIRVTGIVGTWTQPIAQDEPYTVVWNTVTIPEDNVGGSLPSLARIRFDNESSVGNHTDTDAFIERVAIGLRSHDLAPNFVSIINISDQQNGPGISVAAGTDATYQNDPVASTGRSLNLVGGGTATNQLRWSISIPPSMSTSFFGSFKVFVLYTVQTGTGTAQTIRFLVKSGSGYTHNMIIDTGGYIKTGASPQPTHTVHEVGEITVRPDSFSGDNVDRLQFDWYSTTGTGLDVDFYAMVLIPTDEWFGDFSTDPNISFSGALLDNDLYLSVDSTRYLNRAVVADLRQDTTDLSVARYKQSHNGPAIIKSSGRQVFHFLLMKTDLELVPGNYAYYAAPNTAGTVRMYRNRRYHYGRGNE